MRPIGGSKFVPDPRGRGLPDLTMIHQTRPRLAFVELKTQEGILSAEQEEFLRLVKRVGAEIAASLDPALAAGRATVDGFVWRPGNEAIIEALLRA